MSAVLDMYVARSWSWEVRSVFVEIRFWVVVRAWVWWWWEDWWLVDGGEERDAVRREREVEREVRVGRRGSAISRFEGLGC